MKLSDSWKLKKIGEEAVLMPLGQNAYDLRKVINLNSTSVELYTQLQLDKNEEDLVKYLIDVYQISEEIARKDVHEFITKLIECKVIIDE